MASQIHSFMHLQKQKTGHSVKVATRQNRQLGIWCYQTQDFQILEICSVMVKGCPVQHENAGSSSKSSHSVSMKMRV